MLLAVRARGTRTSFLLWQVACAWNPIGDPESGTVGYQWGVTSGDREGKEADDTNYSVPGNCNPGTQRLSTDH